MSGEIYQFPLSAIGYLAVAQDRGLLAQVHKGRKFQRFVPVTEYSPPKHSFMYVREFHDGLQCSLGFSINGDCDLETIEIWREPPYLETPYGDAACFDTRKLKSTHSHPQIISVAYKPNTKGNFCYRLHNSGRTMPLIEVSTNMEFDAFTNKDKQSKIVEIDPNFSINAKVARDICFSGNAMLETPKAHTVFKAEQFCKELEAIFSPFFAAAKTII